MTKKGNRTTIGARCDSFRACHSYVVRRSGDSDIQPDRRVKGTGRWQQWISTACRFFCSLCSICPLICHGTIPIVYGRAVWSDLGCSWNIIEHSLLLTASSVCWNLLVLQKNDFALAKTNHIYSNISIQIYLKSNDLESNNPFSPSKKKHLVFGENIGTKTTNIGPTKPQGATGMSCRYLVTGWFHPYNKVGYFRPPNGWNKHVINQLTNDRYDHFHGHPSRHPVIPPENKVFRVCFGVSNYRTSGGYDHFHGHPSMVLAPVLSPKAPSATAPMRIICPTTVRCSRTPGGFGWPNEANVKLVKLRSSKNGWKKFFPSKKLGEQFSPPPQKKRKLIYPPGN